MSNHNINKKIILNLGCGKTYIKDAINVDFGETKYCDQVVDLNQIPWIWANNSVDEIYMLHILEHFDIDMRIKIFKEAYRILKTGGLLHVQCPHHTSMLALTCPDHKTVYGTATFGFLEGGDYISPKSLFKKELIKINYLMMLHTENKYINFDMKKTESDQGKHSVMGKILKPFSSLVQFLINSSPIIFERCWCYWVGGADEIIYRGRKI